MKKTILISIALIGIAGIAGLFYGCRGQQSNTNSVTIPEGITVLGTDVVYAQRQVFDMKTLQLVNVDLKMDIVGPKNNTSSTPRPLIIFFHGMNPVAYSPAWEESYKYYSNRVHGDVMIKFAQEHNCVVAFVDYVPTTLKWEDISPNYVKKSNCKVNNNPYDPLYDAIEEKREFYFMVRQGKEAVRFLKSKHLDYNIDLNNITVAGFSAGGEIAAGIAFMSDPNFRPSYTNAQASIVYDNNNKYPKELINFFIPIVNLKLGKSYQLMQSTYSVPIPRPDLGNLEGAINYSYDSKVKNVVLLNTAMAEPVSINQVGPRLFIYGSDEDGTLKGLQKIATVPCTNNDPLLIFSAIKTKAEGVGYQNGVNLKVIKSPGDDHQYNQLNLPGGYANVTEAVWDFID